MSNLVTEVQKQQIDSPLVTLFEIYLSDSTVLYLHPGVNEELEPVKFRDRKTPSTIRTYSPMPMEMSGIEESSDGAQNRPTIVIANVASTFKDLLGDFTNKSLIGKKIVRRQTLKKYLYGEELDSNPPYEFPIKSYIIERISSENNLLVEFELSSPFDLATIQLPNRIVIGKYCSWIYQGAAAGKGGCVWAADSITGDTTNTHKAYFTVDDEPIVPIAGIGGVYAAGTTYTKDAFVSHNGSYWYSKEASNLGNTPGVSSLWGRARVYTAWAAGQSYTNGSYVEHSGTVWKAKFGHLSTISNTPSIGSSLWSRGDLCGKTLLSCKKRFQFVPASVGSNSLPSVELDTSKALPFGGFPGSLKFR